MTVRVWPARKGISGNTPYIPKRKVIDTEKIGEIAELCRKLCVGCHAIEDPSDLATKIIITVPYKEEE